MLIFSSFLLFLRVFSVHAVLRKVEMLRFPNSWKLLKLFLCFIRFSCLLIFKVRCLWSIIPPFVELSSPPNKQNKIMSNFIHTHISISFYHRPIGTFLLKECVNSPHLLCVLYLTQIKSALYLLLFQIFLLLIENKFILVYKKFLFLIKKIKLLLALCRDFPQQEPKFHAIRLLCQWHCALRQAISSTGSRQDTHLGVVTLVF